MQLMALIVQICGEIMEDVCCQVITNVAIRVSEVAWQNSGYTDHVIHKG